eukprot:TRINITY_DN801_c1_g2_i2.p1 TRINITY_DN801_c1_g2~~TRINITY_DN801_c1_g2_i2.p1  ORF type:complete len:114 (-),score=25.18 TRINITY_DN801_c1_g2_i2:294-635(-)
MEMLKVHSVQDIDNMEKNKWGIREPDKDEENVLEGDDKGPDLILVPGLGFDHDNHRLGRGKGYYDRYIARCRQRAEERGEDGPYLLALCHSVQVVDEVAIDEYDVPMDEVIHG